MRPEFTGREALLTATDRYPFARQLDEPITGFRRAGALLWVGTYRAATVVQALGDGPSAVRLYAQLAGLEVMRGVTSVHLPRVPSVEPIEYRECNDWSYLWTTHAPEYRDSPVPLTQADHPAMAAILDEVLSYSGNRPDRPDIRQWWGVFEGERLVAIAGDRSRYGVGYVAGIAVARDFQGRGYGSRITRALTARLVAEFGVCALGVMAHNTRALVLWERLGYHHRVDLTSLRTIASAAAS